ncbi:MAG: adenosylcobinamide-GDP ribazoletransferase [Fusobacteriaceae bacterium]
MKGIIDLFKITTRLPIFEKEENEQENLGKSFKFYPVVGIILGLIMYSSHLLLARNINSSLLLALLVVTVYVIITGAMQLNGLANTFGGIFGFRSKQKMLDVMKEGKLGTNGVIALILYFLLNILFLSELETLELPMGAFLLIYPVIGRMNAVVNCATTKVAKAGVVKHFVENTNINEFFISFLITILYSFGVLYYFELSLNFLIIIPIMAISGYYFAKLINKKIAGVTEDTLGAVVELTQILTLFLIYFIS